MTEKEDTPEVEAEETVEATPETPESEPSEPVEEPQKEEPLYAGKYKSPQELEKAYQEAQRLISQQGSKLKQLEKPELPSDKQAILKELQGLGVMTKEEFQREQAVEFQKAKDDKEIQSLGLEESQANALRRYASHRDNLSKSMTECWEELTGSIGGKVVSRKTTIKPKTGHRSDFKPKSASELARMPKADYDKYWADYAANNAG